MTETEIIQHQADIVECAKSFRKDANDLMNELAREFNFSLDSADTFPFEIYKHKYNNKGYFKNSWTFYFHGAECRFDNLLTGQVVEFIYITKPEFGFLDGYFLYNYMTTSKKFKKLGNWFGDHRNVWTAIDLLADRGILTKSPLADIQRNIIAL